METSAIKFWQRGMLFLLLWLACGLPNAFAVGLGQISDTDKYAWSENSGWLNFSPTYGGVTVHADYLTGYVWAANVGWIKLGADGGGPYANTTSSNWGVNRNAATGALSGYAWGENIGWVNFNQVTTDPATGNFDGYAWSANIGYIHFQNANPAYKVKSSSVVVSDPGALAVPATDDDGSYTVSWAASASGGVSYVLQEATDSSFATAQTIYSGAGLSYSISGHTPSTYYYRVKAVKSSFTDSAWRTGNACLVQITAGVPASITVVSKAASGKYTISWGASATPGVSYVLQEATNYTFTQGLRSLSATGLSYSVTHPAKPVKTYYYRVKATGAGYTDSAWRTGATGCAVPGTTSVATPGAFTFADVKPGGKYTVKWKASATAGATYVFQEATDPGYTAVLRTVSGRAISCKITGRTKNVTYYYRVRAIKAGAKDSGWRAGRYKCTR